jgi:hypothetical protein
VAFALVAIMGVLPTGMTVQKDNREDTIINQDGMFWLEAMRSGSHGIDDLTNYVEYIQISNSVKVLEWKNTFDANSDIKTGEQIIGLLSTPKYMTNDPNNRITNTVIAYVRAINGAAMEKGNPKNEFTFRYRLLSEVVPALTTPPGVSEANNRENEDAFGNSLDPSLGLATLHDINVMTNLYQFRVLMRWPLFQQGANWVAGNNRRTVRGMMNGRMNAMVMSNTTTTNFFVEPNTYSYVSKATTTTPAAP